MKMLKRQSIGIAFAILLSLCFVINSDAASITYMYVFADGDLGDGANTTAYVYTDEDIVCISWSVDGVYSHTTEYGEGTRFAAESFTFTGHIKGNKHKITAEAWFWDGNNCVSDSATDKFKVYKPIITSGVGSRTGVSGHAVIYSQDFDGFSFSMSGYTYAYNGTEHTFRAHGWFRQQEWDSEEGKWMFDEKRDDEQPVDLEFEPGEGYYVTPETSRIEFIHGRPMRKDEERFFNAHTHLQVSGKIKGQPRSDDWEADTKQQGTTAVKFTEDDNPEW